MCHKGLVHEKHFLKCRFKIWLIAKDHPSKHRVRNNSCAPCYFGNFAPVQPASLVRLAEVREVLFCVTGWPGGIQGRHAEETAFRLGLLQWLLAPILPEEASSSAEGVRLWEPQNEGQQHPSGQGERTQSPESVTVCRTSEGHLIHLSVSYVCLF